MSHKFEVCCFDSELIGTRKECDRLSCEGKHTEFNLFYHQNNNKTFYCLSRKGLGEYWRCVVQDQETFCSEKCNACDVRKFLARVFVCLQNSYFFNPRNDVTVKKSDAADDEYEITSENAVTAVNGKIIIDE